VVRILFVSNGHGEAAIAERIAQEIRLLERDAILEHFPLVGTGTGHGVLTDVGPRRLLPSGGLVAMGNVGAFARDLRAGFPALFAAQVAFLRSARGRYDTAVAVGDAYALALTLLTRLSTVFVGTAKSAYVAPYGRFERLLLRKAARAYVRDERTAIELRALGVPATSPGNVIADLHRADVAALPGKWIGLLPGSRSPAYRDALTLGRVIRALAPCRQLGSALLSVAATLDGDRFAVAFAADGWSVEGGTDPTPFTATRDGARIVAWKGELGALFAASTLVVGQAGTANEAAAGAGVPVVALEGERGFASDWYRMRQRRLLGDALVTVPAEPRAAAGAIRRLLADPEQLARMRAAGVERIGRAGGARQIAAETLSLIRAAEAAS
jgi:uncharacterized protein (TIGR03492 family)